MYAALPFLRIRGRRLSMLAFAGTALLAACDTEQPVAPKPAVIPTAAQPALGPGKSGNIAIKLLDQNQNLLTTPFSQFKITGPGGNTWYASDNDPQTDADTTVGLLVIKSQAPGQYKACEVGPPIGLGVVGQSCQYTDVFIGSTSGLFFYHGTAGYLKWTVTDNGWKPIGGTVFRLDSTNVTIGDVGDNAPADADPAVGIFGVNIPFEAVYKVCVFSLPAGYVLGPNQPSCFSHEVKMNTGWDLGNFYIVPIYSATWNVIDGVSLIGPSTFQVVSKGINITVVDNLANDYNPTLGQIAVKLPNAGDYSVCETVPPANHWNATPSCKRIKVAAGVPALPGTFINYEKQVPSQ